MDMVTVVCTVYVCCGNVQCFFAHRPEHSSRTEGTTSNHKQHEQARNAHTHTTHSDSDGGVECVGSVRAQSDDSFGRGDLG